MQTRKIRRANVDTYDPKQRFVGGIVLFLIMLLIYSILKILLGFSSVPKGYILEPAKQDEEFDTTVASRGKNHNRSNNIASSLTNKRLPTGFVFLDLDGNALQPETYQNAVNSPADLYTANEGEEKWYVQAASFQSEERAQNFAQKIQDKNIAAEVYVIPNGRWFAVRLAPENDRNIAKQQYYQLRRTLHVRPALKKIN